MLQTFTPSGTQVVGDGSQSVFSEDVLKQRALGSPIIAQSYKFEHVDGSHILVDGTLYLSALYVPAAMTITGVIWSQVVKGVSTGDNQNRVGLYTSDGTNLTLVASSTNDLNMWDDPTAGTAVQKAFTTPYSAAAGSYVVGLLPNWSGVSTTPTIGRKQMQHANNAVINTGDVKISGTVASQTTLPSSIAWTGVTASSTFIWAGVY